MILTPFHSFIVGLTGGLIVGACLCYLWLSRKMDNSYDEWLDLSVEPLTGNDQSHVVSEFACSKPDSSHCSMTDFPSAVPANCHSVACCEPYDFRAVKDDYRVDRSHTRIEFKFASSDDWRRELSKIHHLTANSQGTTPTLHSEHWLEVHPVSGVLDTETKDLSMGGESFSIRSAQ